METTIKTMIRTYINEIIDLTASLEQIHFNSVLSEIEQASKKRHTIFLLGDGSSSSTVSHFANDLTKNSGGIIADKLGFGIKVIPLSDNMPFFTAVSNDISMECVYTEYLRSNAVPGDLLIIFSSGIPYKNLVEAARYSCKRGLRIVSVTGDTPGELMNYSHVLYRVNSCTCEVTDSIHMFLCHSWAVKLRNKLTRPVVFLDRDGVINKNRTDYVKSWNEFCFFPRVAESIRRLNNDGYAVIVVTNQSAVGRNIMDRETLEEIHRNMLNELYNRGALISKIYCCTHSPDENCTCRKPHPGLIRKAFDELPIDRNNAIIIGDSYTDIEAGCSCGLTAILLTHNQDNGTNTKAKPDYSVFDLPAAVDLILSEKFQRTYKDKQLEVIL